MTTYPTAFAAFNAHLHNTVPALYWDACNEMAQADAHDCPAPRWAEELIHRVECEHPYFTLGLYPHSTIWSDITGYYDDMPF